MNFFIKLIYYKTNQSKFPSPTGTFRKLLPDYTKLHILDGNSSEEVRDVNGTTFVSN